MKDPLPAPLLRLTPLVRQQIYRFVGLASWDPQEPYKFDLHGHESPPSDVVSPDAPRSGTFHGLLLTCRAIYDEAAALLYSANRFVIHYAHASAEPLAPLHALTATSLASLTSLTVVLNQASCHHHFGHRGYHGSCCLRRDENGREWIAGYTCEQWHVHNNDVHDAPLLAPIRAAAIIDADGSDPQFDAAQRLLAKWHSAAAYLSIITSGRLNLGLVCDIDPQHPRALEVARSATAPLGLMPQLGACRVRLCKARDPLLQQVAQDAVSQALRITRPPYETPPPTRPTLTSLPRELRLRILEYTDLITPSREVTWSPQDQAYVVFSYDSYGAPDREYRDQFSPCFESFWTPLSVGCFCRRRHTAFSPACTCWAPPGPGLFLICRTLYRDAQLVFFSGNHFIVHDYKSDPCWAVPLLEQHREEWTEPPPRYDYPSERFGASRFLREVVPTHCLAYLRFLELVFPVYPPASWPQPGQPAMQEWWTTIDWLQDKINAPALTIRLVGADVAGITPDTYREVISASDGDVIMQSYQELLRSLKPLADNGLARFYAHLPYPWRFAVTEGVGQNCYYRLEWVQDRTRALKEEAERFVLGDRYKELYADGKEEPRDSFWTWTHYAQN